jgi:fumarate reductase flavoprotein subunit
MAQALGAKLTHMHNIIPSPGVIDDPANPGTTMRMGRVQLSWDKFRGSVWINKRGERFVNEDGFGQDDKEKAAIRQPDMTFFVLFDEKARLDNPPIVSSWTREKFELEAARGVLVQKAASIDALARAIDVDPAALRATLQRYNGYVREAKDPEFSRDKMQYPIEQAPFYAIRTVGFFLLTMGGLKVNHRLQVEDENGRAIAGLYAAGEVLGNGQLAGDGLVGGMSVTPAITFGRIAARNALDDVRAPVRAG